MAEPVLVSACLMGVKCRYDGRDKRAALEPVDSMLPVCPEVMAGFGIPRPRIERSVDGTIRIVETREDVTGALSAACDEVVAIVQANGVRRAILKQNSPSCGTTHTWMDGALVPGAGLLADRLSAAGVSVAAELQ